MLFQGGSFFVHEGMPYCEIHYHAKRGSLCAGCHKPITGNVFFFYYPPPSQQYREKNNNRLTSFSLFTYYAVTMLYDVNDFVCYCSFVITKKQKIRSLHHGDVQEVSPGTLCLLLLPETVEEGHVQRARRQAVLPRVFRAPFRMKNKHLPEGEEGRKKKQK